MLTLYIVSILTFFIFFVTWLLNIVSPDGGAPLADDIPNDEFMLGENSNINLLD
jgi:hypothetical protein